MFNTDDTKLLPIGTIVVKKSRKPFSSGRKEATILGVIDHPQLPGESAYTFDDAEYVRASYVESIQERDQRLMDEMPDNLGILPKRALLRAVQHILGTNMPESEVEWVMIHRQHACLVDLCERLLREGAHLHHIINGSPDDR